MDHAGGREKLRILLVEDNPADVYLMRYALKDWPVTVEWEVTDNGQTALETLLNRDGRRPELVLMDMNLPKLRGAAVLEALRGEESLCRLPTVLLSSTESWDDNAHAEQLAHGLFLLKPLDLDGYAELSRRSYQFWCDCRGKT